MSTDEERAARYSDLFENTHEHVPDCAYCPICATISVVRNTKPEVLEHLANAARELIIAAGILVDEAEGFVGTGESATAPDASTRSSKVRRIDLG